MKLIDLLIKISKGDYPKCFKYDTIYWHLEEDGIYYSDNDVPFEEYVYVVNVLNDEVEIKEMINNENNNV